MIQTPSHSAFPSGHSTQAYIIAYVFLEFLNAAGRRGTVLRDQLLRQADRVAINRTIAGVHFPVDSSAGHVLGTTLAEYFVHRCKRDARRYFMQRRFHGELFDGDRDFDPRRERSSSKPRHFEVLNRESVGASPLLGWIWDRAIEEWRA